MHNVVFVKVVYTLEYLGEEPEIARRVSLPDLGLKVFPESLLGAVFHLDVEVG